MAAPDGKDTAVGLTDLFGQPVSAEQTSPRATDDTDATDAKETPKTTAPSNTTAPAATTVPLTTTAPTTTVPPTTTPPTTVPPTTVPPTTVPPTTVPPTTAAPTTAAPTTAPPTTAAPAATEAATAAPQEPSDGSSYPIRYEDGGLQITIEKQWYLGTCCYIAHLRMSDYTRLKTGLAQDAYGYSELPASFAESHDCLLTVNGDYAEGDEKGVLRGGVIYSNRNYVPDAVYSQGSGRFSAADGATLSELAEKGYTESFGFGAPTLVRNGKCVYGRKDGGKKTQRTMIGTTGVPGELYIVVTEGRYTDGKSPGLQYYEAGDLLESLGCDYGIALDGGGSSSMVWNGRVLNNNVKQKVTGFVYLTKG